MASDSICAKIHFDQALPYYPCRNKLYTVDELMEGYSSANPTNSLDMRIEGRYQQHGGQMPDPDEALAQRIHDLSIDLATAKFIKTGTRGSRKLVGIMGG